MTGTKPQLEKKTEDAFVAYALSRGCEADKLRIDGEEGFPDRTVLTPVGTFFIEFKRTATDKPSATQRKQIKKLRRLGYLVLVTHELQEAKDTLDRFLEGTAKEENEGSGGSQFHPLI